MKISKITAILLLITSFFAVTGCSTEIESQPVVTVRLWDQNVAEAYDLSFTELFEKTGIRATTEVIPWADYWSQLKLDLATNTAADIFWVNAGNFIEYSNQGLLREIHPADFRAEWEGWEPSVVSQYTHNGKLWGIPQLSDPGIGLLYNKEILDRYGVTIDQVRDLEWDPNSDNDSFRTITQLLTRDSAGRSANEKGFDKFRVETYGFNAAFDLNAVVLNFLGSNEASWQKDEEFKFDSKEGREAIGYLVDLINKYHVSPPALETNPPTGSNLNRDLFIQGRMALFETGAYNLANVSTGADFEWGVVQIPRGPAGAVSVTNGIVAAASAKSKNIDAQNTVLKWLAEEGTSYFGKSGAALSAVSSARLSYFEYWRSQEIDISPMIAVLKNGYIQAPRGARYGEAEAAYLPYFTDIFNGNGDINANLADAESKANEAMVGQ